MSLYIPLGAVLLWNTSAEWAHREEAEQRAAQYAANSEQQISQVCLRRETRSAITQCMAEAAPAAREQQRREEEVQAQEETATWTWLAAMLAFFALGASMAGIWAVWRSIKQGQKTYEAFVAVEDASLVVDFLSGHRIESIIDGVPQPDSYFFPMAITNIGRSTARLHAFIVDDGIFTEERTIKPGDTIHVEEHVPLTAPIETFTVALDYSSPVREKVILLVHARMSSRQLLNGGTGLYATVIGKELREG